VGGPLAEGYTPLGGDGGATGGSDGEVAGAGAGSNTSGGKAGTSEGGTASGAAAGTVGNAGTSSGGKGGSGSGGKGATGGGGTGASGGAISGGGKGGTGGSATGGSATGGSATGGTGATGGSGASGGSSGGVNLITNSGFETNTTGWSVFGGVATIASSTAQAHSGSQSLLITGRTQTYQGPQYSVLSLATPGTSYTLSLWGRLPANATGSLIVTLHYTCSGGSSAGDNYFTWVASSAASASSWTQFSGVQTFPACAGGGTMSAAAFYVESPTATLSYYIDDVVFTTP